MQYGRIGVRREIPPSCLPFLMCTFNQIIKCCLCPSFSHPYRLDLHRDLHIVITNAACLLSY